MIDRLRICESDVLDPYRNLATELGLLREVAEDELVMYLWRNERTVVIGRNQNAWAEVDVAALEGAGGHLARRLSGGGAVYHDSGNLNFTFVARSGNFDVARQTAIVLDAVRSLGFDAEVSGRNDLCIDGRKFSGHSYYREGDRCFHNGTILIRTDASEMGRYLRVAPEKLISKGVQSVRSRTLNLTDLQPTLSVDDVKNALLHACEAKVAQTRVTRVCANSPEKLVEMFASREWIFGKTAPFTDTVRHKFDWGLVEAQLEVRNGLIANATVFTDALDPGRADDIRQGLIGKEYSPEILLSL